MIQRFGGNARYHNVVEWNGLLFAAGQTFADGQTIEEQAAGTLDKIEKLLEEHGSDKQHILSACVYLKDMSTFAQFNKIYDAWVTPGYQSTRTCVEAKMATDKILVEITIIAAKKDS